MDLKFKLTDGAIRKQVTFNENDTIGDIINYLKLNCEITSKIFLYNGKTFFFDENKKLKDCGFRQNGINKLSFGYHYDG